MNSRISAGLNLAGILTGRSDLPGAQAAAERVLVDVRTMPGLAPTATFDTCTLLADVSERRGLLESARRYLREAAAVSPGGALSALGLFQLGAFEVRHDNERAAAHAFAEARSAWRTASVGRDRAEANICWRIAKLFEVNRRWESAEPFIREAIARHVELLGPGHIKIADLHQELGETLQYLNRPEEARQCYEQAATILRSAVGEEHPDVGTCLYHQARLCAAMKDQPALLRLKNDAAALSQKTESLPANHPHRSGNLLLAAFIDMHTGLAAQAEPRLRECVRLRTEQLGPGNRITLYAHTVLGECLARQGRFEEAQAQLLEFVPRVEAAYTPGSYMSAEARQRLVDLYYAWDKPDLAEAAKATNPHK